jgi:hypothetical protein
MAGMFAFPPVWSYLFGFDLHPNENTEYQPGTSGQWGIPPGGGSKKLTVEALPAPDGPPAAFSEGACQLDSAGGIGNNRHSP